MSTFYIQSALPSITCLVVLLFLPWAASQSLSYWRAIQVYDRQAIKPSLLPATNPTVRARTRSIMIVFLLISAELTFFATSGADWSKVSPLYAQIRHAVPTSFLTLLVFFLYIVSFHRYVAPIATASRNWNTDKKIHELPLLTRTKADSSKITISRLVKLAFIVLSVATIFVSNKISNQAPMYLAATSGAMIVIASLPYNRGAGKRLSFRGLVLWPFLVLALTLALIILSVGLIFAVETYKKLYKNNTNDPKQASSSSKPSSSWSFDKIDTDLDVIQLLTICYFWAWTFTAAAASSLVCFAYRYDASQAGHGAVDEEEAEEIVQRNTQAKDVAGRAPIPLTAVALPRSTLSSNELPTYTAALRTLVLIQIMGTAIDVMTGWQPVMYPTNASQLPYENFVTVSIWPFLAYPLVSIAMIASVCLRSDRTFKSLWTYGEQWVAEQKPEVSSKPEDAVRLEEAKADVEEAY